MISRATHNVIDIEISLSDNAFVVRMASRVYVQRSIRNENPLILAGASEMATTG